MISALVGMVLILRGGGAVFNPNGRKADDVIGAGSDANAGTFESGKDVAADFVFDFADLVRRAEEADGEFDPVVGDAEKDAGRDVGGLDEEALLEAIELGLGKVGDFGGVVGHSKSSL